MDDRPFMKRFGHDLTTNEIEALFVKEVFPAEDFCRQENTFVWGFRGTGKTMLLRYFDIEVQYKKAGASFKEFIDNSRFIGFHFNFMCGVFDIPNLRLDGDGQNERSNAAALYGPMAHVLSEHLIVSAMIESIIKKIARCMDDSVDFKNALDLLTGVSQILKMEQTIGNESEKSVFQAIGAKFTLVKNEVIRGLTSYAMGDKTAFTPLKEYLTFENTFIPFINELRHFFSTEIPLYLMIDDVKNLHIYQQKQLNNWIGRKEHQNIFFKIAAEPLEYQAFGLLSDAQSTLQYGVDYKEMYLDFDTMFDDLNKRNETYTEIANKRLECYFRENGQGLTIEELLPPCSEQTEELNRIAEELKMDLLPTSSEIAYRKWAKLHQTSKRIYAGLDDIAVLSFGSIREFLTICDRLFQEELMGHHLLSPINPLEQDQIIRKLSKQFPSRINTLTSFYEKLPVDEMLDVLTKNLMELFEFRFNKTAFAEKSFNGFIVKDQVFLPKEIKSMLRRGIERQYFRKSFKNLENGGRQDIFIINSLLFPAYGLEIQAVGSKIEFDRLLFEKLCKESGFFRLFEDMMDQINIKEEKPEYEFARLY